MKKFIVTAVDTSDTADGKARVCCMCNTQEEARNYVQNDMEAYADDAAEMNLTIDFNRMSASTEDGMYGCEWNIEEVEIPMPTQEKIKAAEQVLVDNGIDEDEADTVLQAVGYTLLDTELYQFILEIE